MKKRAFITLCALFLLTPLSIFAQKKQENTDSTDKKLTVVIDTKDGSRFVGKFIDRRSDTVVIQTESMGLIYLAESQIKSIDELGAAKERSNNPSWFRNPYSAQGLFFPTGIGLKKGEGNYQNLMVGLNSVQYGITDHFSLGAGLEIISLVTTGSPLFVYIQPKLSYSLSDSWHLSGGTYLFRSFNEFSSISNIFTLPFANLTFGNRDNNLTFGTFFPTQDNQDGQLFILSGQVRTGRKFALMGEVYTAGEGALVIFGGRFMTESFNLNFGLFSPSILDSEIDTFVIPYIGFTIPFGNKNK
jgi:hypothetical protein